MDLFHTSSRWTFETVSEYVRRRSFWMEAIGGCLVLLGVIALGSVVVASFASTLLFGGLLLAAGTAQIAAAFMYWRRREDGFVLGILLGCLCAIAGVLCLTDPARSMETLTFILAGYFIASGVFRLILVMNNRFPGWGWGVVSAGGEILLGILTFAAWPASSLILPGTLLGLQLIFSGSAAFATGMAVRRLLAPTPGRSAARPATRFQH